jgi:hypothetical protein
MTAVLNGQESPPTYAGATAGATTPPAAVLLDAASEQSMEEDVRAESAEPVYKLPPIPPPWSSHFSDHYMRLLCTFCFSGNRDLRNAKCSDCQEAERSYEEVDGLFTLSLLYSCYLCQISVIISLP